MKVYRNTSPKESAAHLEAQGYGEALSNYLSLAEVVARYGLHRITLAQACQHGRLKCQRIGRMYVTTAADVEAAVAAGTLRPRRKE